MSNPLQSLLTSLSPAQQAAIKLIKTSLDCFNSADGTGLFSGVDRYNALAGRVEICSVQADSLPRFWALLLRRMQWPVPPKAADEAILQAISAPDAHEVLRVLATETASVITLARMLHDKDKAARKSMRAIIDAEVAALDAALDDDIDFMGDKQ